MTDRCPECGAPRQDGMSCWEQLGLLIAWEADDPELQAEHFLTVACNNLQHPAEFTDQTLAALRTALTDHLEHGVTVAEIRRRHGRMFAGNTRVRREEAERRPTLRPWSMTIADVYFPGKPTGAAARVREWASRVRSELDTPLDGANR